MAPSLPIVLPHFSAPARDETMAPLGGHERDRSLSGIERWMRRRTHSEPKARDRLAEGASGSSDETRSLSGTDGPQSAR